VAPLITGSRVILSNDTKEKVGCKKELEMKTGELG